jgi:hypothetical protein
MELNWRDEALELGPADQFERDVACGDGRHDIARHHHLTACRGIRDARSKVDRVAS